MVHLSGPPVYLSGKKNCQVGLRGIHMNQRGIQVDGGIQVGQRGMTRWVST